MKYDYDVIVIGAGNGGLAAASVAAKTGNHTLLIERHNLPGGAATSFTRGRFEFEPSLHELAQVGPVDRPGNIRKFFNSVGVDVDFTEVPDAYRIINTGKNGFDISMPTGIENFIMTIEKNVPGSATSLKNFFGIAIQAAQAGSILAENPDEINMDEIAKKYPLFIKYGHQPYQKVLDELQIPLQAQQILMAYWCYIGIPGDEFEFSYFASMVVSYLTMSAYIPKNRSHEISTALVQSLLDNGGDAWFNTEVTKIIVEKGEAVGVSTADGDIYAKEIIADVLPDIVYGKMMNAVDVPISELKKSNARKIGTSGFLVYLGINKSAEELGVHDYSVFMANDWDSRHQFQGMNTLDNNDFMIMNCLNVADPNCSPKGTSIFYATQLFFGDTWDNVTPEEYPKLKDKLAKKIITRYEQATNVNLHDHIEEIEVATPITFARYLRGPEGDIYGYYGQPWDQMLARTMSAKQEDESVPHLHFCGGAGHMMDGYSSAYISGMFAAKQAVKNLQKEQV